MPEKCIIYTATGAENLGDECILASEILQLHKNNPQTTIVVATYDIQKTQHALDTIFQRCNDNERSFAGGNLNGTNNIHGFNLKFKEYFPNNFKKYPLRNIYNCVENIWQIFTCDEVIIGGGGILYDTEKGQSFRKLRTEWGIRIHLAKWFRKKIQYWNIGVDLQPNHLSGIRNWFQGDSITTIVRDSFSYGLLKSQGINAILGKDSVFSLPLQKTTRSDYFSSLNTGRIEKKEESTGKEKEKEEDKKWGGAGEKGEKSKDGRLKIGLAFRDGYLTNIHLEEIITFLSNRNIEVVLISQSLHSNDVNSNDYTAFKSIAQKHSLQITSNLQESLEAYYQIDGVIGMRLHSCIIGKIVGLPTFCLSYSKKTTHVLSEAGVPIIPCTESKEVILESISKWLHETFCKKV